MEETMRNVSELVDAVDAEKAAPDVVDYQKTYAEIEKEAKALDERLTVCESCDYAVNTEEVQVVAVYYKSELLWEFPVTVQFDPRLLEKPKVSQPSYTPDEIRTGIKLGLERMAQRYMLSKHGLEGEDLLP